MDRHNDGLFMNISELFRIFMSLYAHQMTVERALENVLSGVKGSHWKTQMQMSSPLGVILVHENIIRHAGVKNCFTRLVLVYYCMQTQLYTVYLHVQYNTHPAHAYH